jgi:hypothetical protein
MSDQLEARRPPIPAGGGFGKVLLLDAFSGIAGDMTVAALVDLGVPVQVVLDAVAALGLEGVRPELSSARVGAIGALKLDVVVDSQQPERTFREIDELLRGSRLAAPVRDLAARIFLRLAEAEGRVHQVPVDRVHFHEVGAADAIVDIVGAAASFVHLDARVVATPLPLGRGFVDCRHGTLPLPAPATVGALVGVPTYDAGIDAELVTPTGASIVATVATEFARWPAFVPERIGWGAGTTELPDRPNALRAILGTPTPAAAQAQCGHVLLEANVDDLTGEVAAHALRALRAAGALDTWAVPVTMKKGRPGLILSAVARADAAEMLVQVMLRETTTIGVRKVAVQRTERPRRMVDVETRFGTVPVKVSEGPHGPPQMKPEFDACAKLAEQHGVPVREVIAEAITSARAQLGGHSHHHHHHD